MEVPQEITDIVRCNGFDYAKYLGEYKGWQIYQPCFESEEAYYGRPCFLHVKGNRKHWSKSHDEASKTLHYFYK